MHSLLKGAVAAVSGTAMALTLSVGLESPAHAATSSTCQTTFKKYHTIMAGTHGTEAKAAQCLLHSAGYSVRADGSFSSADAARLKMFQVRHHIPSTGVVRARSWMALLSRGSRPTLRYGQRNAAVKRLQRSLTASGRYVPATGYYGPITRNAVKSLQRSVHYPATGVTRRSVWNILQSGSPPKPATAVRTFSVGSTSSKGATALAFAKRQLGERYVFGASGPNAWDCSGLTAGAWRSAGVLLPHNARMQYSRGKAVSKANLRPGDLVFFYRGISHVAIYAGGGRVIHSPRPGSHVAYIKMSYMPFHGARRPG